MGSKEGSFLFTDRLLFLFNFIQGLQPVFYNNLLLFAFTGSSLLHAGTFSSFSEQGYSCCRAQALEQELNSCSTRA